MFACVCKLGCVAYPHDWTNCAANGATADMHATDIIVSFSGMACSGMHAVTCWSGGLA